MSERLPLSIRHLYHCYDKHVILSDLNLSLQTGEFLSVLGASGCGKSTLLRVIAGLSHASQGTITLDGQIVSEDEKVYVPAEARRVGLVFQDYALFPFMSVRENIAFGLKQNKKQAKSKIKQRVDELLQLIHMEALADRKPNELSGGQQQRVALARALAPRPNVLLLDEPFANVDAALRQALGDQLQMLVQREGVSVILVTHDRNEAFAMADRVVVLESLNLGGTQVVQCDTPEQIYHCPANKNVARLTGSVNFIPATAQGIVATTPFGPVSLHQETFTQGVLVVRPEMIQFEQDSQGEIKVMARLFQGHSYRLLCQTPQGQLLANSTIPVSLGACGRIMITSKCWLLPHTHTDGVQVVE